MNRRFWLGMLRKAVIKLTSANWADIKSLVSALMDSELSGEEKRRLVLAQLRMSGADAATWLALRLKWPMARSKMLQPASIEETALAILSAAIVAVLVLWMTGCAHVDRAQGLDGMTTVIALENGFTEANPLFGGLNGPAIFAVKMAVTQAVKLTPEPICQPGLLGLTVTGYGAALWNIGVMAGSGPAAIPLILGLTLWQWDNWAKDAVATCANPW